LLATRLPAPASAPAAERRLVSVLFADLVGFTPLSEGRDAEDVRELLSRYFETARTIVERYGGTVEKFIGDAVMAVWGAPVAQEDDSERAVRAALDLVEAITALGGDVGAPELRARAGVLTGEAAVTLGAEGQGMVAGDLVNTASRIQSAAAAGTVLVGETTKRATESVVVYEAAGVHELKGKAEAVPLWRALRVIALRGGVVRSPGLEPPFVGREGELRLVKQLFHAAAEDRRAQLVSVVGVAGIGKSRLVWEFEKYIDGLLDEAWWHKGRCLSYGDGVAFWALAEMVRGRAGIVEDESSASARAKLEAAVREHLTDPEEQRFVQPRLAHLLGIEEAVSGDQENLFAAARLLFERLAEKGPTVLVFEDIHWADSALLDFVEYLLDWSRELPLFILTLARPELTERRPTWGAGKRNVTSISLDPLAPDAMEALLTGPVPGLPEDLRRRVLERAEGVPFYAVETVRMLLDRGLLVRTDDGFTLAGAIDTLEVPETLQALIAARLDGLDTEERRIVQDAAVLGRTFTIRGLSAISGSPEATLRPLLDGLVRKEILTLSVDPLSSERGQYGFIQDLVKKVAYDTLSRRDRKQRHLGAAEYLRSLGDEDEIAEVIAAHYVDAFLAVPDAEDAASVKADARAALVRAADRAASLGATSEAQVHFERAAELADSPTVQAELLERAGQAANTAGRAAAGTTLLETALGLFEQTGATHAAARVSARLAESMWEHGRHADALDTMERALKALSQEERDADFATLAAQLGRFMFFSGRPVPALEHIEAALETAEALLLPETLSNALNTKAILLESEGRHREGGALLRDALELALEHDKPSAALRAYYNIADLHLRAERYADAAIAVRDGLTLARRVGNRYWERNLAGDIYPVFALGRWDDAVASLEHLPLEDFGETRIAYAPMATVWPAISVNRGDIESAERVVSALEGFASSADEQERASWMVGRATVLLAGGDMRESLTAATRAWEAGPVLGIESEAVREAFVLAVESALRLGETATAEEFLRTAEQLPIGRSPQFLQAHTTRFRARMAAGTDEKAQLYRRATARFRELDTPFWVAVTLVEQAESLAAHGTPGEAAPLGDEAREIFEQLGAQPWIDRLERMGSRAEVPAGAPES
jgi:predicted ATPase/class 3 adenylate cyclase